MSEWWYIGAEVILVMTAFGACFGGLIHTGCASMRKSRCSKINCCCFSCIREIESDALVLAEEALESKSQKMTQQQQPVQDSQESGAVSSQPQSGRI